MTVKNIISPRIAVTSMQHYNASAGVSKDISLSISRNSIDAHTPIVDALHRLLDSDSGIMSVTEGGETIGYIDSQSMLEGLGRLITPRDDSSTLTIKCRPEEYSASAIAIAVEDADAHLVDLFSSPDSDDMLSVTLRVRHIDPSAVAASLNRHGYEVIECHGRQSVEAEIAAERLAHLALYLNI